MTAVVQTIAQHGYLLLFLWVLAEQIGLPIPAVPALLAAGVLIGSGKMSLATAGGLALIACFIADTVWFSLGRHYGGRIVGVLCRMSFTPDACVRKTTNLFEKHGPVSLLLAKFVPGVDTLVVPIAGNSGMTIGKFAFYDIGGCGLYVLTFMAIGTLLANSIEELDVVRAHASAIGFVAVVMSATGLLIHRVYVRQKFRRDVRMARITPENLLELLNTGKKPFVVDLRHPLDFFPNPQLIPTAVRLNPDELLKCATEIPRDRDIILYCT